MINRYADASGDRNPLHVDPAFAVTTPFGRTIAHGLLTLAFISQLMTEWAGNRWAEGGELDVSFVGPVFPGDEVELIAEPISDEQTAGGLRVTFRLSCDAGGRPIVRGTASCMASTSKTVTA
jgi:3-hydroxybutyryl-CoA dehydratase